MNPKHSSIRAEHYTPMAIIAAARQVLGGIDLDPASDAFGNSRVQANRYIDKYEGALIQDWYGCCTGDVASVFCNPPGGKLKNKSIPALFWQKLMDEISAGHVSHAIFLAFSIELLQVSQASCSVPVTAFPMCIPKNRISFVDGDGKPQKSNTHASAIIYVPGTTDNTENFIRDFSVFGSILQPVRL